MILGRKWAEIAFHTRARVAVPWFPPLRQAVPPAGPPPAPGSKISPPQYHKSAAVAENPRASVPDSSVVAGDARAEAGARSVMLSSARPRSDPHADPEHRQRQNRPRYPHTRRAQPR
eukprot:898685-Rhodomonas_salina.2